MPEYPTAIVALAAASRAKLSNYPEPFRSMMSGRVKRTLSDLFGLTNFGVNITVIPPGAVSALRQAHTVQDEFVYVVLGTLILQTDDDETVLSAGMCAGFKAGTGNAHRLADRSEAEAVYLEVGDRTPGDSALYPDADLIAHSENRAWVFTRKDGVLY